MPVLKQESIKKVTEILQQPKKRKNLFPHRRTEKKRVKKMSRSWICVTGSKVSGEESQKKTLGGVMLRGIEPLFASTCSKLKNAVPGDYQLTGKRISTHRGQSTSQRRHTPCCPEIAKACKKERRAKCENVLEDKIKEICNASISKSKQIVKEKKENIILAPVNMIIVSHKKKQQKAELEPNQAPSSRQEAAFKRPGSSSFMCFGKRVYQNSTQYSRAYNRQGDYSSNECDY
eukprot:TRINITY_DN10697_c0_g7_i2.p1 TRINITY_DN10697_c0_g7~~TRINITY_DN10697_c0_g7_i2.p1  ORF type:complete len:232 (-),score=41.30 TRINITY_DN10697_c0_g7_i2:108-803(-)